MQYDETGKSVHDFGGPCVASKSMTNHVEKTSSYSGAPDYWKKGDYIVKDKFKTPQQKKIGNGTHHWILCYVGEDDVFETYQSKAKDVYPPSVGTGTKQDYCTQISTSSNTYMGSQPDANEVTVDFTTTGETYNAVDNYGSGQVGAEITFIKSFSGQKSTKCERSITRYSDCDESKTGTFDCDSYEENVDYYPSDEKQVWPVSSQDFKVTYEDMGIDRNPGYWGPVNGKEQIFNGFSQVNPVDTPFGYHTQRNNDGRQGSNDKSVSANHYNLIEDGNSFYAKRVISNVADADGPDGQSDGLIAVKEGKGVQASTKPLLQNELWENNKQNYITKSDLPNMNCQGNTVRCLKSLDLNTKQSGWGTSKNNSFEIQIRK